MRVVSAIYNDYAHLNTFYSEASAAILNSADQLSKEDILLLHGGADISPYYYGERSCQYNHAKDEPSQRDKIEEEMLDRAIALEIPIFGVCRGAQWLSILAGGKLFQHVVGHDSGKHVLRILPDGAEDERMIWTNTCHHQQMDVRKVPISDYTMLATHPQKDTERHEGFSTQTSTGSRRCWEKFEDPEIVYFNKLRGFAVQGHPEWMGYDSNLVQYCLNKSKELWGLE